MISLGVWVSRASSLLPIIVPDEAMDYPPVDGHYARMFRDVERKGRGVFLGRDKYGRRQEKTQKVEPQKSGRKKMPPLVSGEPQLKNPLV
jgi:hypothetical protein